MNFDAGNYQGWVAITLLVTEDCNYRCAHCIYSCGDQSAISAENYIQDDILNKLPKFIEGINNLKLRPLVVIVGGEPTLILSEYERVLKFCADLKVPIEMVTNGWWLARPDTTKRIFTGAAQLIAHGVDYRIQISNDTYHEEFRPDSLKGEGLDSTLRQRLIEFSKLNLTEHITLKPRLDKDIVPIGRGSQLTTREIGYHTGSCQASLGVLSFNPSGELIDICCHGSQSYFGSLDDHAGLLLELGRQFVNEIRPTCRTCKNQSAQWKSTRLSQIAKEVRETRK